MGGGSGLAGSVVIEAGNVGWGSVGFFILWVIAVVVVFSGLLFLETLFWVICFGKNEKKKFKIFKFQFLVMQKRAPNKTKTKKNKRACLGPMGIPKPNPQGEPKIIIFTKIKLV